jgi:phosphocarrier protein FPr
VSVKSLSKLLSLGARRGQVLEIIAEPSIAADALPALLAAIEEGLGEEVEPLPAVSQPREELSISPRCCSPRRPVADSGHRRRAGHRHRPGAYSGAASHRVPAARRVRRHRARALKQALASAARHQGLIERSKAKAIREIFITHQEMLDDPELTDEVDTRLKQGESAEAAWMAVIEAAARQQESLQDALLAERAADLRDIGRRVLAQLCGSKPRAKPSNPTFW